MLPLHLGNLHPVEQVLVLLIAFGPFLIAGVLVVVIRRRDAGIEAGSEASAQASEAPQGRD